MINIKSLLKNLLKRPSLSNDFSIIITFIAIATFILAYFFGNKIYQDHSEENIAILESTANKIERIIKDDFDYTQYQMNYISTQIQEKGSNPYIIRNLLGTFRVKTKVNVAISWNMFSWMNKNKFITIDGTEGILLHPKDLSSRDYVPKTIEKPGEMHIGKPVYGAVSQQWIIPAGVGVVNKKGKYIGSIVFGFDIGNLIYKLEQVIGSKSINFAILNDQKEIIAKSSNFILENEFIKNLIANKNLEKNPILSTQPMFNKENSFITGKNSQKYPIYIITQYDNKLSYYKFWHEWSFYMLEYLIALICIIILLFLIKHRIINPVVKLSKTAKLLSKGFIDAKIPHYKSLEAHQLAKSLINIKRYIKREVRLKLQIAKAQKKARDANISKTKFLNSTSHDLRNYISSISGLTDLILDKNTQKEIEQNEDLKIINTVNQQSKELLHFVEDLLDTNQTQSGNFSLGQIETVNINELINRIIILNKTLAINHNSIIQTNLDSNNPTTIECDQRRMKQILTNLLSNAIKYSPKNTTVRITTKQLRLNKQIYIEISDEGIGMNKDEIKMALCGDGQNIDKSDLNKTIDSHGIGLPVVKKLVELHDGKIEIDSKKGHGTKIKLYFDLHQRYEDKNTKKSLKILLISEDENNQNDKIIKDFLKDSIIDKILNDKEIVKITLLNNIYDIIILDLENLEISDIKIIEKIRKINQKIPILFYSNQKDLRTEVKLAGISQLIEKNENLLIRNICKWCLIKQVPDIIEIKAIDEKPKRILLADDEPLNKMMLERNLKSHGFEIDLTSNGQELLTCYKNALKENNPYDLIIVDINMPVMNGIEVTQNLKLYNKENNLKDLPIIAYSGDKTAKKIHYFLSSGVTDYFNKGDSKNYFIKLITFWIGGLK